MTQWCVLSYNTFCRNDHTNPLLYNDNKIKIHTSECLCCFPEQLFAYLCKSQPLLFQRLDAFDALERRCSIKQKKTSRCMIGDLEKSFFHVETHSRGEHTSISGKLSDGNEISDMIGCTHSCPLESVNNEV